MRRRRPEAKAYHPAMVLFMVERGYADALDVDADGTAGIVAVNDDVGVRWVYSFLSADKRKSYCLYEAESEEAIHGGGIVDRPGVDLDPGSVECRDGPGCERPHAQDDLRELHGLDVAQDAAHGPQRSVACGCHGCHGAAGGDRAELPHPA